jgi:hypothetical protein
MAAVLLAIALHAQAGSVDEKLLGMLLDNGAISQAQHDELMADLAQERQTTGELIAAQDSAIQEQSVKPAGKGAGEPPESEAAVAFREAAGWAASTAFHGDLRVRNEYTNIEDEPKDGGRDRDRQRIRARIAAVSQVNSEVETGIRIATGSGADRRSTNQDLGDYFDKKTIWLDLGYIDYHPDSVPGLNLIAGKMLQPWVSVEQLIWDSDVNPEGFAAKYTRTLDTTTLFGSAGYFVLEDNVNGDGVEWDNDLGLYALQGGATFDVGERLRMTLGASLNAYNNDGQQLGPDEPQIAMIANGNTTDEFTIYEAFGQIDVEDLPIPLSFFGQYATNADARDYLSYTDADEDTAWLLGTRTKVGDLSLEYNYRDVERNAVVGYFTDSNFAAGYVGSSGHRFRARYDLLKNFNATFTWFHAQSDVASRNSEDADVDVLQLDLNAKF